MADDKHMPNGIAPHLTIREGGAARAIDFYKAAFGAEEKARMVGQDGKRLMHAHLLINDSHVLLNDDYPEYIGAPANVPTGVTIHIEVDDADYRWNRAVEAGATVRVPLENQFWGARYGQIVDPFGHTWSIGGPVT